MERIKTISRKSGAQAETYRPELLADDEPRYLRRQKPVEIRRKKFAGRGWSFYRRVAILGVAGIASVSVIAGGVRFLLYSPQFALAKPDQIELNGNKIVARESVLKQFLRDRNKSVLQIPEGAIIYDKDKKASVEIPTPSAKDGKTKMAVNIGISNGAKTELLGGLKEGDQVVLQ